MWLAVLPIIRVMFCHDHFSIIIIVLIIINVMVLRAGPKKTVGYIITCVKCG